MIFFTADQHYDHQAILKYCKRPFENTIQMDRALIRNHNEVVNEDDDVYMLGDFSLSTKLHKSKIEQIVSKLKGRKHLILGNHDIKDPSFWVEIGFQSVHYPYFEVEEFICVHDPSLSQVDRSKTFLCGHVHDLFLHQKNCINVGVDVRYFKPICIDLIRDILEYVIKRRI